MHSEVSEAQGGVLKFSAFIFILLFISYFFSFFNDQGPTLYNLFDDFLPTEILAFLLGPLIIVFLILSIGPTFLTMTFQSIFCEHGLKGDVGFTTCFGYNTNIVPAFNFLPYYLSSAFISLLTYLMLSRVMKKRYVNKSH